jgi:hypothetical protein
MIAWIVHLLLAVGLFVAAPALAASIEGVVFSEQQAVGGKELPLRGTALLRYRILFRGYVAALYLPPETPVAQVLEDVPRRLEIEYFWGIPATGFVSATLDGIRKNVDAAAWERLEPEIHRFNRFYRNVEPGDRYQLTYTPGVGTELALNGERLGRIEGAAFASALFSIWLGEHPFDVSLKNQLLGMK